jgi:hypothetical protein
MCLENTAIERHIYSSLFNRDLACLFRMFFDQNGFLGGYFANNPVIGFTNLRIDVFQE